MWEGQKRPERISDVPSLDGFAAFSVRIRLAPKNPLGVSTYSEVRVAHTLVVEPRRECSVASLGCLRAPSVGLLDIARYTTSRDGVFSVRLLPQT
ncbi:MAG: hypothetical protein KDD64_01030 [Bdellovibrionales bacterium]|nr:hypothetical protein [Bdellovibrionales bacterium]